MLVAVAAYGLWRISDQLLYIGPFDRAVFGWAFVMPVWVSVPVVAAVAWRDLSTRRISIAALIFGGVGAVAGTLLIWAAIADTACQFGPTREPIGWILPAVLVGLVIGASVAGPAVLAAHLLRRRQRWWAVGAGAGLGMLGLFVSIAVASATLLASPVCQRPPV